MAKRSGSRSSMTRPRGARPAIVPSRRARLVALLRRPQVAIGVGFGGIALVAIVLLAAYVITSLTGGDLATAARVNGVTIDRAHLRDRVALDAFLLSHELDQITAAEASGKLDAAGAASARATLERAAADPVESARTELVDEALVAAYAGSHSISASSPDLYQAMAQYLQAAYGRDLRWVSLTPPAGSIAPGSSAPTGLPSPSAASSGSPSTDSLDAALSKAQALLATGSPAAAVAAQLTSSGWPATGGEQWVGADGPVVGIDDQLVAAARSLAAPGPLGPLTSVDGRRIVGRLAGIAPGDPTLPSRLRADAATTKIADGALASWANARALEAATRAALVHDWTTTPSRQVRGSELVVGADPGSGGLKGPWVELASLDVSRIPADALPAELDPGDRATAVAAYLRAQPNASRSTAFRALAAAANTGASGPATGSGELGFLTKGDLAPAIGSAAFAASAADGSILGPLTSDGRTELFLVEARYAGSLDQRSNAALAQGRAPGADFVALAGEFAPASTALATDSGWWSELEFGSADPTRAALFTTSIGAVSDPVVLDGSLALFRPTERRTALPDPIVAGRLAITGFDGWLAQQRAAARIELLADPLGLATASPPRASLPTVPPIPTPQLPSIAPPPNASEVAPSQSGGLP